MPKNGNHTGQQSSSPRQEPRKATKPEPVRKYLHMVAIPGPMIKRTTSKAKRLGKTRAGSGHLGQRVAPNDLGAEVGEASPQVASSGEGVNSTEPELNRVQRTRRGTSAYGTPVPVPSGNGHQAKNPDKSSSKGGGGMRTTHGQVWQDQSVDNPVQAGEKIRKTQGPVQQNQSR